MFDLYSGKISDLGNFKNLKEPSRSVPATTTVVVAGPQF